MLHQHKDNPSLEQIQEEIQGLDYVVFMSTYVKAEEVELVWNIHYPHPQVGRRQRRQRIFHSQYLTTTARQHMARGARAITEGVDCGNAEYTRGEICTKVYLNAFSRAQVIELLRHCMELSYKEIHQQAVNEHLKNSGFFND